MDASTADTATSYVQLVYYTLLAIGGFATLGGMTWRAISLIHKIKHQIEAGYSLSQSNAVVIAEHVKLHEQHKQAAALHGRRLNRNEEAHAALVRYLKQQHGMELG